MQSTDYEKLVEGYLLTDRQTLVAPQYLVRINGRDRWIDVLAVRPKERVFYLVEVTENRKPNVIAQKLKDYHAAAEWLAERLALEIGFDGRWQAIPWIIIRREAEPAFRAALEGIHFRCSFIEDLIAPAPPGRDSLDPLRWGRLGAREGLATRL